jgi:hypothetical protein
MLDHFFSVVARKDMGIALLLQHRRVGIAKQGHTSAVTPVMSMTGLTLQASEFPMTSHAILVRILNCWPVLTSAGRMVGLKRSTNTDILRFCIVEK